MSVKVGINGFGRIGRLALRALKESKRTDIEIVAINDLTPAETCAYLFKYDSVHGTYPGNVSYSDNTLIIDGNSIAISKQKNPSEVSWNNVDIVFECTGMFTNREAAAAHSKTVIVSAPTENADITVVYGINHKNIQPEHKVISNASCTTNCLAPAAWVLHKSVGIEKGYVTTVHAYTSDQRLIDTAHKDPRRARAAAINMIPTSTGAARAVGLVIPELKGKLDGTAIRVPTPNVSLIDAKFLMKKSITAKEINELFINSSKNELKSILGINNEPLVSSDFNHSSFSSIVDLTQTQVVDGNFCRILSWYDNEWGFVCRMLDVAATFDKKLI